MMAPNIKSWLLRSGDVLDNTAMVSVATATAASQKVKKIRTNHSIRNRPTRNARPSRSTNCPMKTV